VFVPSSVVTGLSVFSLKVRQGILKIVVYYRLGIGNEYIAKLCYKIWQLWNTQVIVWKVPDALVHLKEAKADLP
jgi:hypothetical protein